MTNDPGFFIPSYYEGHSLTRNSKLYLECPISRADPRVFAMFQMNQMNQMNQMKRQSKDLTLEVVDG